VHPGAEPIRSAAVAEPLTEADESFRSPGAEEQWSDSLYFVVQEPAVRV
jgi:hypothetical protein